MSAIITDKHYKFRYYNAAGSEVTIVFYPNKTDFLGVSEELELVENVFTLKEYRCGFEDTIKDTITYNVPSTLEVDVDMERLNVLAKIDDIYYTILSSLISYIGVGGRYNLFDVIIEGVVLSHRFFLQREIFGSLLDSASMTLIDIVSCECLLADFRVAYK